MKETVNIAGYCRISVDDELDRDNTSIENQKSIIADYVDKHFPGCTLTFYEDRDRSGYTFEQREGYQKMRPLLMDGSYPILVVKDFSRFSRRNSRGLVELEDLRDAGVRIISIGDSIDYPTYDDWTAIQFRFLVNEMPVTDASKKVKCVISRRQEEGRWICAVPYGYVITNTKTMAFEVEPAEAQVVRMIYDLYNDGWGYKKIANYLTEQKIPTPRMSERERKLAAGEEYKRGVKEEWSLVTVQGILENDFYIGTLRQGKYTRKKINGDDMRKEESDHIVFENHHEPIVDFRVFSIAQENRKKRTKSNYRGQKKYDNFYSGFLFCGDCGSPMFAMSRKDLSPAYTCGTYHRRGLSGCTSHHIRTDVLDELLKQYVRKVKENSAGMLDHLNEQLRAESVEVKNNEETAAILEQQLDDAYQELKATKRQRVRDIMRHPEKEEILEQTYDEMEAELESKISGLQHQIEVNTNKRSAILQITRIAKTALEVFDGILQKEKLDKADIGFILDKIVVFEDHIDIHLKADIDALLKCGLEGLAAANFKSGIGDILLTRAVQKAVHQKDKVFDVNVISEGDPLEIYTEKDGGVIFRKYSPMGDLQEFAAQMCESIGSATGHIAAVADRDSIIALHGAPKRELLDKPNSPELEKLMEQRKNYLYKSGDTPIFATDGEEKYRLGAAAPILSQGDLMGCVLLLLNEGDSPLQEADQGLAKTAAGFLGKQMES
ncbi:MAG: stage V sporulation T C-terminal domain-containing protein [Faecousia sp.]